MRGNWWRDFEAGCPSCHQPGLKTSIGIHPFFSHQQTPEERGIAPFYVCSQLSVSIVVINIIFISESRWDYGTSTSDWANVTFAVLLCFCDVFLCVYLMQLEFEWLFIVSVCGSACGSSACIKKLMSSQLSLLCECAMELYITWC